GLAVPGTQIFPNLASEADPAADCNNNQIPDGQEIATHQAQDCNHNGVPDACDIARGSSTDCNGNGLPDACEVMDGTEGDTNVNGVLDPGCEVADCNHDGTQDFLQVVGLDLNHNGYIDGCETDCNNNGIPDYVDLEWQVYLDCDDNGIPDDCEPNAD